MTRMDDLKTHAIQRLGKLEARNPYPDDSLSWLRGRIPESLINLLETLGLGTWGQGKWQVIDAARFDGLLRQTLREDPDFAPEDCTAIAMKGFGGLWCWHRKHQFFQLDVLPNQLAAPDFWNPEGLDPAADALSPFGSVPLTVGKYHDLYDSKGDGLFAPLVKAHGPLPHGQIFAPRLHPAIGGTVALSNFRPVPAVEALALLHQMEPFMLTRNSAGRRQDIRQIGPS